MKPENTDAHLIAMSPDQIRDIGQAIQSDWDESNRLTKSINGSGLAPQHIENVKRCRESNRLMQEAIYKKEHRYISDFVARAGADPMDPKILPVGHPFFSVRKLREVAYEIAGRMREAATAESTLGQFLRGGINQIANEWSQRVQPTYQAWCAHTPSDKVGEWYAPADPVSIPGEVTEEDEIPTAKFAALDIFLKNRLFAIIIGFGKALFDDDQTGQVRLRAQALGTGQPIRQEIWAYSKFIGSARTVYGKPIPASETKPSNESVWPWSTSLVGGGANRPTYYGRFTRSAMLAGLVQLENQLNTLGENMLVTPDTLLVSPIDRWDAMTILQSAYTPTGAAAAGVVPGTYAENILKGVVGLIVSRFMPQYAWGIGQSGRGFICQVREPNSVTQENPTSGPAFSQRVFRFKTESRDNFDHTNPRFFYLGNDGSQA